MKFELYESREYGAMLFIDGACNGEKLGEGYELIASAEMKIRSPGPRSFRVDAGHIGIPQIPMTRQQATFVCAFLDCAYMGGSDLGIYAVGDKTRHHRFSVPHSPTRNFDR